MMPVSFKDKLLNYEVQPPMGAWEAITADLAENKELEPISTKLNDYESAPPLHAWEVISADLTQNKELKSISEKLYDFELAPPPYAWEEIKSSIANKTQIADKLPVKTPARLIYKIMAAATLLALIVTAGRIVTKMNFFKNNLTVIRSIVPITREVKPEEPAMEAPPSVEKIDSDEISPIVVEVPVKSRKAYKESNKALRNTKVKNPLFNGNELGIIIAAKPIRNAKGEIIQDNEVTNNTGKQYISITGPNGQQTKISSKFLHMLLFINDDSDIDEVDGYFDKTFLESLVWKTKFQDWRNKIINTSLVPSSTNFMDILEFKDLILGEK